MSDTFNDLGTTDKLFSAMQNTTVSKEAKEESSNKDIKISRYQDISKDIKISSKIDIPVDDYAEAIRRVVKEVGRETSPLRLTPAENVSLEDIIYSLKREANIRTDKTQIIRIALNYIINDYLAMPSESILTTVLERLNA